MTRCPSVWDRARGPSARAAQTSSPEDEFSQENGEDTECRQLLNRLDHVPVRHASGAGYGPRSREALELVTTEYFSQDALTRSRDQIFWWSS